MNISKRRFSMPVNCITNLDLETENKINLNPIEHLEMMLIEMKDLYEYGFEILNSIKEQFNSDKNINLTNKINSLKEENNKLFDEIIKYHTNNIG